MEEKYYLSQDQSSHWYIVPVSKKKEWEAWNELDEDDEASWTAPDFAVEIGGSPSLVTFPSYQIG